MAVFVAQGIIARQPGSGRRTVIMDEILKFVEEQIHRDDGQSATCPSY